MTQQVPLDASNRADDPDEHNEEHVHTIADDLAYKRLTMVNIVYYGQPGARDWVLIDAGLPGSLRAITRSAERRFGVMPPAAILLTHGHADHVGVLEELAQQWDVPIYAHALERPYLDGTASYPPPDPTVGGGLNSLLSPILPRGPVNVGRWLQPYPEDGSVPHLPGWRWLHTPGHSVGHVSLWRESDRSLVVGDAFITTRQESAYAVMLQSPEMHGPPMYFTHDWLAAGESVRKLAALDPDLVVTGHGRAMRGPGVLAALKTLAQDFEKLAVPRDGKYTLHPVHAEDGSAYIRQL